MTFSLVTPQAAGWQVGQAQNLNTVATPALTVGVSTSQFVVGGVDFTQGSGNTLTSVKDNAATPNTYPLIGTPALTVSGGTYVQLFSLDAPPGTPTIFTATMTGLPGLSTIYVAVFNRGAAVTTDQHNTATGSSATPTGPSLLPTSANQLVFAALAQDAGVTATATSPMIKLSEDTFIIGDSAYMIQTTATTIAPSFATGATSSTWAIAAATFKEAAAGGAACSGKLLTLGVGCWLAKKLEENPRVIRRDLFVPRLMRDH